MEGSWVLRMVIRGIFVLVLMAVVLHNAIGQTIYHYQRDNAHIVFFDKRHSQYLPHMMRMYEESIVLHQQLWQTDSLHLFTPEDPVMLITDWEDDGNGGVSAIPYNVIQIGMAPLNFSYQVSPSTERYHHLFRHEYTHVMMTDKATEQDLRWRRYLGGKFSVNAQHPVSALWSYLGVPRWYAPRWYHEGIACFLETWMGGGVGRALGGYDEMYFRALVKQQKPLCSVVGLESDGTTRDFLLGVNSYLYGTRFVNYLVYRYGLDKLIRFYNHTNDSHTLFNKQFEEVYGAALRTVWDEWIAFEHQHQQSNLDTLALYPLTPYNDLCGESLGSVSPPVVDTANGCCYVAVNYTGDFAHLERIDLVTGKRKKLHIIDGPMFYQTSYVALDQKRQRLIFTTQNGKYRGLAVYDLRKGSIVQKQRLQRINSIVYDNQGDQLLGLVSNAGINYLVAYDSSLTERQILYTFPFGQGVFDIDVSHSGQYLTATLNGMNGEHSIVRFDLQRLKNADFSCDTLFVLEDANLGQFRFTDDDSALIGSSYYTGVSNLWRLNLATRQLELLSNTDIGLFSPVQVGDSLLALVFDADGMRPVTLHPHRLFDARSVSLLGQRAYEAHPQQLESIGHYRSSVRQVQFGDVYNEIEVYHPFTSLRFTGAYPEITAFRDRESSIEVTPVLGYRFQFSDPLGLHSLQAGLGISPWSHNNAKNQYHADLRWHYWNWTLNAAWNKSDFYDFFGPLRTSRNGWSVHLSYDYSNSIFTPFSWEWGAAVATYGDMDAMPLYQNIAVDIRSFQYATAHIGASKKRTSLGGEIAEQGWSADLDAATYLADGILYPSTTLSASAGVLLPWPKHLSLWFRGALGSNFGDSTSVFGNEYFGGFRNNYIDWRDHLRYCEVCAMPGAPIDAIQAHNYGKLMMELNLPPFHFNNFGLLNLYPTYLQGSLFGTALLTNPLQQYALYYNVGAQFNLQLVLFKYLRTILSVGYARLWQQNQPHSQGEWLFSVKLL